MKREGFALSGVCYSGSTKTQRQSELRAVKNNVFAEFFLPLLLSRVAKFGLFCFLDDKNASKLSIQPLRTDFLLEAVVKNIHNEGKEIDERVKNTS